MESQPATSLWLFGPEESGKTALCSYLAQQLAPSGLAIVGRLGDLLAELRGVASRTGQVELERCTRQLTETPLLIIDDLDRPVRSEPGRLLSFEESCGRHDLLLLARLIGDRQDALRPTVVTSRVAPRACAERCSTISRLDLVRGLLATASGHGDPLEDFPDYAIGLVQRAMRDLGNEALCRNLGDAGSLSEVA